MIGIQFAGIIFGIAMLYLTHLYYRRNELKVWDFILWCCVWIVFLLAVLFPQALNVFLETLGVISAMQLFTIVGFMVLFVVVFYLYKTIIKLQRKVEYLVSELAQKNLKK